MAELKKKEQGTFGGMFEKMGDMYQDKPTLVHVADWEGPLPQVFMDITIGGEAAGRIKMVLRADVAPKTCQNFKALCDGSEGIGKTPGKPLHFQGCPFHR